MPDDLLPIKVILPEDRFHIRNDNGGSARKIFGPVTQAFRERLVGEIKRVRVVAQQSIADRPGIPTVAKVHLRSDALAKSHRPDRLFNDQTCPVIGVGTFSELLIRATPDGLQRLEDRILRDDTQERVANLSTIEKIAAIGQRDRLGGVDDEGASAIAERVQQERLLKVQLFNHRNVAINSSIFADFGEYLNSLGSVIRNRVAYTTDLDVLVVDPGGASLFEIIRHPGVHHAGVVPKFFPVRHWSIPVTDTRVVDLPPPENDADYPIVAVVDSGIATSCGPLRPWIVDQRVFVPAAEQSREHGTFVAGIVVFGHLVNLPGVAEVGGPCKIVDIVVIPNGDPDTGPVGSLLETDLVSRLREVVPLFRDRVKVWNLSLGSDQPCKDDEFSDLARALDAIQVENDVLFVLAAGNFNDVPRTWPPQPALSDGDRICPPADSVMGLTVGALAHAHNISSVVQTNDPSPFSRKGPGPSFIVKPELVHYGGNCDQHFGYATTGVRSIDSSSRIAEDIGTSFSTPLVSTLLANVIHELDPNPSLNLAKALVLHAADYPRPRIEGDRDYYGFGMAGSFSSVVHCVQSSATLVFEDILQPGYSLDLDPFPFPACLQVNGRSTGFIKMTLVYHPPLNASFGLEYCRANVSASLGTWGPATRDGRPTYKGQVPPEPRSGVAASEAYLIKHGFKWSPNKSYRRLLRRGVGSTDWRLHLELLHRADETPSPQAFALVVTIAGAEGDPVYDDMVAALRSFSTQDLQLRSTISQRVRVTG